MLVSEATLNLEGGPLMNYVGIDYHKKYSVVTAVNEEGHVLCTRRLDQFLGNPQKTLRKEHR